MTPHHQSTVERMQADLKFHPQELKQNNLMKLGRLIPTQIGTQKIRYAKTQQG